MKPEELPSWPSLPPEKHTRILRKGSKNFEKEYKAYSIGMPGSTSPRHDSFPAAMISYFLGAIIGGILGYLIGVNS